MLNPAEDDDPDDVDRLEWVPLKQPKARPSTSIRTQNEEFDVEMQKFHGYATDTDDDDDLDFDGLIVLGRPPQEVRINASFARWLSKFKFQAETRARSQQTEMAHHGRHRAGRNPADRADCRRRAIAYG